MRHVAPTAGLVVVLLLAAGCGGGSSGGSWQVLQQAKFKSDQAAYLNTTVGRPSDVEIRVEASPNVRTTTSYSIACGDLTQDTSFNKSGPAGQTPLTGPLVLPVGPAAGCYINLTATKSKPAALTLTLLTRTSAGG